MARHSVVPRPSTRWRLLGKRSGVLAAVVALVAGMLVVASTTAPLTPIANAATVNLGGIQAQVSDHIGIQGFDDTRTSGTATTNCTKYGSRTGSAAPTGTTGSASPWVNSGSEALTAHGSGGSCPSTIDLGTQSAVGVAPSAVATIDDGVPFLLGAITHYNNPIQTVADYYSGKLSLRLTGFDAGTGTANVVTFPWKLWETSNGGICAPDNVPNGTAGTIHRNGCADQIRFDSQISDKVLTQGGQQYRLVVNGISRSVGSACPATAAGEPQNDFWTTERANTKACVYASLVQLRSLKVVKKVESSPGSTAPAGASFAFTSTSNLDGSPWSNAAFTLQHNQNRTGQLLQGESVTVTETPSSDDRWTLTGVICTNLPTNGYSVDLASGHLTIASTPAPTSAANAEIVCTYTNTYTPKATLTLVKQVQGGSARPAGWTLSAVGQGAAAGTAVSGPGNSPAVTNQRVTAGSYQLSETATGATGYQQLGSWVCAAGGTTFPVTSAGVVTLPNLPQGTTVTCTVTNKFSTGALAIVKKVNDPVGGYTAGTTKTFTGDYSCSDGTAGTFRVRPGANGAVGAPETVSNLPTGTVCTVTEDTPTSTGLKDSSYSWGTPTYASSTGSTPTNTVVVGNGSTETVTITNTVTHQTGALTIAKVVQPREGTPAAGYTGGGDRTFDVTYTCRIAGNQVARATVQVSTSTPVTVTGLPATAECSFAETLAAQDGDFADASYTWDSNTFAPQTVTIGNGTVSTTVTNYFTRHLQDLTVSKVVDGAGYTGGTGDHFTVTITGCSAEPIEIALADGGSRTVQVPANTLCSVVETAPAGNLAAAYEWGTPTYEGLADGAVSVPIGESRTVTVTNHTAPIFGRLSVTKQIAGETAGLATGTTFPITVACDNGYQASFDLAAGGTGSTDDLPVGTSCSVSETAPTGSTGLIDGSYVWGTAPADQQVSIDAKDQLVAVTVINTIERAYGSLTIAKAVVGLDGLDGTGITFAGSWGCRYGDQAPVGGTWSTTGAGNAALTGPADQILIGSLCSVTEDAVGTAPHPTDTSYTWGGATITGPVTPTTAEPAQHVVVTNPISRITGTFGISKAVTGGEAGVAFPADATFPFSYACSPAGGGAAITGSLEVPVGGTINLPSDVQIPAGSTCTVTEGDNPAPIDPYRWDGVTLAVTGAPGEPVIDNAGRSATFITAADGAAVSVSATNSISARNGSVRIGKQIAGATEGLAVDQTFAVSLVCDNGTFGPRHIAAGADADFTEVPLGSICRAEEGPIDAELIDGSYAWGAVSISPEKLTVAGENEQYTVTVTNTIDRVHGNVGLQKLLQDNGFTGIVDGRTYTGSWSCVYAPQDIAVDGTWTVTGPGIATLAGIPDTGILVGSVCSAIEDELSAPSSTDPSYRWLAPEFATATVAAGQINRMTVTNALARDTGELSVAKTVTGATAGYTPAGADFRIGYRCYLADPADPSYSGEVAVAADGAAVLLASGIPAGWTCQVSEAVPSQQLLADSSYAWGTATIGIDGQLQDTVEVSADGSHSVEVTNRIDRVLGSFGVRKEFAANTPDVIAADATFSGSYSCEYPGVPAESFAGSWQVTGTGAATLVPADGQGTQFPLGTVCSATENTPAADDLADGSWAWDTPQVGHSVTVAVPGTIVDAGAVVPVTNGVHRLWGGLQVTKTLAGETAGVADGTVFEGAWSCAYRDAVVAEGRWQVAAGQTSVIVAANAALAPATAICSIVEDTNDTADLVDGSYRWDGVAYDPAQVAVAAGEVAGIAVTNSVARAYGSVQVAKLVTGPAAEAVDPERVYTGRISCVYGDDDPVVFDWSTTVAEAFTAYPVLVDSVCTATEDGSAIGSGPVVGDPSFVWGQPVLPAPATVIPGDAPARLVVENPTGTRGWALAKTSDPASGSTVQPGQNIVYTLTATATGDSPVGNVVITDDLSAVLSNATLDAGSIDTGGIGSTAVDPDQQTLTWTIGELPAGTVASMSYTVSVDADAEDVTIRNVVTGTGDIDPECLGCDTEHRVPPTPQTPTTSPTPGPTTSPTPSPSTDPTTTVAGSSFVPTTATATVTEQNWQGPPSAAPPAEGGPLAWTGFNAGTFALWAMALLAAGAALLLIGRRRQAGTHH